MLDHFCDSWLKTFEQDSRFFLTIDLETDGLDYNNGNILLHSISWDGKQAVVFCPQGFDLTKYKQVLNTIPINNQNIKFDLKWLIKHYQVDPTVYFDTMVATQLGWAGNFPGGGVGSFGLMNIAKHLLNGYDLEKETRKEFIGKKLEDGFTTDQIEYAAKDSLITHQLVRPIIKRLSNQKLLDLWDNVEKPLIKTMALVEMRGVKIDLQATQNMLAEYEKKVSEIYDEIVKEVDNIPPRIKPKFPKNIFNPGSTKQIIEVMSAVGVKLPDTKQDTLQTVNANNQSTLLTRIIDWKKTKSVISKFLEAWLEEHINMTTECIYTTFNTCGTATGRMSNSSPNLQQTDKKLRSLIIAKPGYKLITKDYSAFEFRAAAAMTGEDILVNSFQERAKLLPTIKQIAHTYNEEDADTFVKLVAKKKVTVTDAELELVKKFADTDVHRRNAAAIFNVPTSDVDDRLRSVGKCVDVNSWITTNKGMIQLKDLLPANPKKGAYYKLEGLQVMTDVGFKDTPSIYYNGKTDGLKITTRSGRSIICTKTHRFRTFGKDGDYVWAKAQKLKVGQEIFIKTRYSIDPEHKQKKPTKREQNNYILYSYFLKYATVQDGIITFVAGRETLTELQSFITSLTGKSATTLIDKKDDLKLKITDGALTKQLLKACWNKKTNQKILPTILTTTSRDGLVLFLKAFSVQDSQLGQIFVCDNPGIAEIVQHLLASLGIMTYLNLPRETMLGRYVLVVVKQDTGILDHDIMPELEEVFKTRVLAPNNLVERYIDSRNVLESRTELETKTINFLYENNIRRDYITSINVVKDFDSADLSVPENETIVYNDLISHNTLGYAVLYGAGAPRVQEALAKEGFYYTLKESKAFLDSFFTYMPKIKNFIEDTHNKVLLQGYIETVMGRRRYFHFPPKYQTRMYESAKEAAFRESVNYHFQGANADATKLAMVKMDEYFATFPEPRPYILLSIHDEIVVECPDELVSTIDPIMEKIMVECGEESVAHKCVIEVSSHIGNNWTK